MRVLYLLGLLVCLYACTPPAETPSAESETNNTEAGDGFVWNPEKFADLRIIRYQIPGFDKLSLDQKKLVYYLSEAGLCGRDIIWAQNYRHNLTIRVALENIVRNYQGDKTTEDWKNFMVYTKRIWFSNGIHHHYSADKINPEFSRSYFQSLCEATATKLSEEMMTVIFDPIVDAKKVNLDPEKDLVKGSAVNFYDPDITNAEVDAFYDKIIEKGVAQPISYGLNSKLIRQEDGSIAEEVYKADGLYGPAIKQIIPWLEKAITVAENEPQKKALELLIEYYQTGDLKTWDEYNVAWVAATEGDIDYINSFIEVYQDPKGYKATYESVVEINDFEASDRMAVVAANAQYFEDNSPIMDEHKKKDVVGISYKVVSVASGAGDMSPSFPIGINLPNANWIRAKHGSKSVSLGNIIEAYDHSSSGGLTAEFAHDEEEIKLQKEYGSLAGKISTALHEVIGHASGKLNEGVGTPKETLKNYASALEEARADLVALYYIMDPKLIELGIMPSMDVAKAEYDGFMLNGPMLQLRRIEPGKTIEESHMRNRQLIAKWAFEKGEPEGIITQVKRNGNTYIEIKDYDKLRDLFGELLKETQRIKSEGDYAASRALIEGYGVQVEPALHQEVLKRSEKLDIPPYGGFINPRLVPVRNDQGEIMDVKVEYPDDFSAQMLEYADKYAFLIEAK